MGIIKKSNAQLFLFVNAVLWGSSYVWSKMLLGYLPRFTILFLCSLGGLTATMILCRRSIRTIDKKAVVPSVMISLFSILSNTFCMLALQYTGSSNTAFIVQMSLIITPLIMALVEKKLPEGKIMISAVIALCGLFLLICDFETFRLNIGDLLALGNAVFFSLHIAGLRLNSKKVHSKHFTFIYYVTTTVVFFIMAGCFEMRWIAFQKLKTPIFPLLITASTFVAVTTIFIQSTAIKFVRPEKAVLLYTFEPLTALLLGFIFIGERPDGIKTIVGFIFILFSVLYTTYKPKVKQEPLRTERSTKPLLE